MIVQQVNQLKRFVKLLPENTIDLLNVFRLVNVGDIVYSETSREIKKERADGRYDSERVLVTLGVEVEKKIVHPLLRRVSFTGRIIYESRELDLLGKYHTVHVYPGLELKIESRENFSRLHSFSLNYMGKRVRKVLCLALDDEKVAISEFSSLGLKILYSRNIPSRAKIYDEKALDVVKEGFDEVVGIIQETLKKDKDVEIVVLGSGFSVENFLNYLRKSAKNILERIRRRGHVSSGGEEGLREALRSGELGDYAEELKPVKDSLEVEEFIKSMSTEPDRVALGLREVMEAVKVKAVEKVLVSESFLWENIVDENVEQLLDEVEHGRVNLRVILDGLEASEKILGLGGIVATLYYPFRLSSKQDG